MLNDAVDDGLLRISVDRVQKAFIQEEDGVFRHDEHDPSGHVLR